MSRQWWHVRFKTTRQHKKAPPIHEFGRLLPLDRTANKHSLISLNKAAKTWIIHLNLFETKTPLRFVLMLHVIRLCIFMRDYFIFKKILSLIFQQWNYSNDVILKLFNCSSLLFISFCVSLSWTYIVLNGLNKSRLIIGKQKPGKILINKTSVFFSWIRKWFHSWDRMFWYFHSCSELVKNQNILSMSEIIQHIEYPLYMHER